MKRQAGFVLIFALWILAGCALLLAAYARSATQPPVAEALATYPLRQAAVENAAEFVARHLDQDSVTVDSRWQAQNEIARMEYAAAGGVHAAANQLIEMLGQMGFKLDLPQGSQVSAMLSEQRQKLSSVAAGQTGSYALDPLFAAGGAQTLRVGERTYQIHVAPVSTKPNLNKLSAKALKRYLVNLGVEETLAERFADALRHWRGDRDVLTASQFEGDYRARSYVEPGTPISDWSELALLSGASPDLLAFLRRHFSLAGPDARVALAQADPAMIAALADLDPGTVATALAHLKGERRDIALGDAIGATNAAKFDAAVSQSTVAELPLRVEIAEQKHAVSLTYDVKNRTLADVRLGR